MISVAVPAKYDSAWMNGLMQEIAAEIDECVKRNRRLYIGSHVDTEIVLISPDGSRFKLGVANDGILTTEASS